MIRPYRWGKFRDSDVMALLRRLEHGAKLKGLSIAEKQATVPISALSVTRGFGTVGLLKPPVVP